MFLKTHVGVLLCYVFIGQIKAFCVMYLLDKLKPFEQKEHFSLKEQNGSGWNLAYVRKGPACQGDQTQDLQVGSRVL